MSDGGKVVKLNVKGPFQRALEDFDVEACRHEMDRFHGVEDQPSEQEWLRFIDEEGRIALQLFLQGLDIRIHNLMWVRLMAARRLRHLREAKPVSMPTAGKAKKKKRKDT
jgi:hypothetical protein